MDTILSLIFKSVNQASPGIKQIEADTKKLREETRSLSNAERIRSLDYRKQSAGISKDLFTEKQRLLELRSIKNKDLGAVQAIKEQQARVNVLKIRQQELAVNERLRRSEAQREIALKKIKLNGQVDDLNSGLEKSQFLAMGLKGIIGVGITAAIALAAAEIELYNKQFQSALKVETDVISGTTTLAREFKLDRPTAKAITEQNQIRVEILGRDLPIETKAINEALTVFQNAGGAKLAGGDINTFNKQILGTTSDPGLITRLALKRQELGSTITDIQFQQALASLNPNSNLSDLSRLEFFRTSGIIDQLSGTGFDGASATKKLELLNQAMEKVLPDEAIAEMQGTAQSMISRINDTLFADRTGVFGFLRDLEPETEGSQTVFAEAKRTLDLIIGEDGIFFTIGEMLGIDPLVTLRDNLRSLNDWLQSFNDMLEGFKDPSKILSQGLPNLGEVVGGAFSKLLSITTPGLFYSAIGSSYQTGIKNNNAWGQIKTASSGLLNAISSESRNSPHGSQLVLANDSEDILPRGRLQSIINQSYSTGQKESNSSINLNIAPGAIQINSQSSNSESIASEVINQLEIMLNRARLEMI